MATTKVHELRKKQKSDLESTLKDLKAELSNLRFSKVTSANASKIGKISVVRKAIARVNTVITQKKRGALVKHYREKRFKPLDLRSKRTRSLRRALSKKDANRKTLRQVKKLQHFPQRRYAVKN